MKDDEQKFGSETEDTVQRQERFFQNAVLKFKK